tara:strand:- start:20569 stop:21999 length:1431 start_codon:yes stop_codon:yes gene_type:complete
MITVQNYLNTACHYDFSTFPEVLKKGDDLTRKALAQNSYSGNETIKRVVDTYIEKLNTYVEAQKPKPSKASKEKSKKASTTGAKKAKPRKPSMKTPAKKFSSEPKSVEMLPEEIRFIRRYVAMNGKVKSKLAVMRLLSSLQKAMLEKRIRKTSPYAKEILQIQDQLIRCADRMGDEAEINIAAKNLEHYKEVASSQRIRDSIALLKRFVAIHGREGIEERAERLLKAMERMVKNGKISKDDPYATKLNEAYKSLKIFLRDKKASPEIKESELNGIYGLLGMSTGKSKACKPKGLSGVVSSEDLMNMDFETIGLRGKFQELIGDPSVGFTAMVFGQPKSGKSTLMLDFAHHLANKHGEVLYVAFEEGYGYTLKEKITRIGAIHPRLHFSEELPGKLGAYDFVFIDSVSRAGMELEDVIELKNKYPRTSFIFIFHATKDGKFKGGNELAHEVDVIIEVENGMAKGKGRFGQGEMEVRF